MLRLARMELQLERIGHAKGNGVGVAQGLHVDFLPINEDAVALPAVFKAVHSVRIDQGGTAAGDAAVRELQLVVALGATPNEKGGLGHGHPATATIGCEYFQHRLSRLSVRHS